LFNISVTTLGITHIERGQPAEIQDLDSRDVDDAYLLYFNESLRSTGVYMDSYNCLLDIHKLKGNSSKYWLINYDLHQELKGTEIKVKLNHYRKGKLIADEFKAVDESNGSYKGWWLKGKKNGEGTYKWKNGDVYVGEWLNDNRHGQGTYKWMNGSVYRGEWRDDKMHGRGTLTLNSGYVQTGEWVNGSFIN